MIDRRGPFRGGPEKNAPTRSSVYRKASSGARSGTRRGLPGPVAALWLTGQGRFIVSFRPIGARALCPSTAFRASFRIMPSGNIRIIAGRWRRRRLPVADSAGLRPTPARVRETLFNWLQEEIEGRSCLDLFAGTGALGFEAASRGAKSVVMVERERELVRAIRKAASDFDAREVEIFCADALAWRPPPGRRFDLVFLDPPWSGPTPAEALKYLESIEAVAPWALACIESDRDAEDSSLPLGWTLRRRHRAGQVRYCLLERGSHRA